MGLESNTVNVSSRPASPSFESYEVILESVKRRVQETLLVSPKKGCLNKIKSLPRKDAPSSSSHHDSSRTTTAGRRRSFLELEDSDLDQEDDDLDWEFSVCPYLNWI